MWTLLSLLKQTFVPETLTQPRGVVKTNECFVLSDGKGKRRGNTWGREWGLIPLFIIIRACNRFPALGSSCVFSYAWHCFLFSCTWRRQHVFPRLALFAVFPRLALFACFPARGTVCLFSRAWHRHYCLHCDWLILGACHDCTDGIASTFAFRSWY